MNQRLAALEEDFAIRSPNDERRASVRYRVPLRVPCRPLDDSGRCWNARVRDVSSLGIALVLSEKVEISQLLEIELVKPNALLVGTVLARLVHVMAESRQCWLAGCAFVKELNQEELQLFHADAVRSRGQDNRRWIRFPCNVETVCYTCETSPGESRPARVLNISPGGIGLLLPCQFAQGTLLHFKLPSQLSREILVRVVRVMEQSPGMWFLGCEFAHQLGNDELEMLLR